MKNWHTKVSFLKSGVRIIAFGFLIVGDYVFAGEMLIMAELLGILEEIFE